MAKTLCNVTRESFKAQAQPLKLVIMQGDKVVGTVYASPKNPDAIDEKTKQPSNKSLGWFANDKSTVEINGTPVAVQMGFNITAIGSDPTDDDVKAHLASLKKAAAATK